MANMTWAAATGLTKSAVGTCATGSDTFGSGATDGADVLGVDAFDLFIAADSGQTLSGAGTLECYVYNTVAARWARFKDWDVTVTTSAVRDAGFAGPSPGKGYPVLTSIGRVAFRPNGVTLSGGGLTIYLNCTVAQFGQMTAAVPV